MVKPVKPVDNSQKTGTVAVRIKVDRNGNVVYAKYTSQGSNTLDSYLIRKAEEAALKCKFDANPQAASEQIGKITFQFKVQG